MISNDIYIGTIRFDTVVVENAHEAIVTREQFEKANEVRRKRHEIYGDSAYVSKYLLVGFAFCARCGARYHVKHNYGDYKYYECYSRAQTVKRMAKADRCDNKNWRLDDLEARVEAEVTKLLSNPKYFDRVVKEHEKERKIKSKPPDEAEVLQGKIADLEKQIGKLMDLFQTDSLPADVLSTRIDKLYREKIALTGQLNNLVPQDPKKDFDAVGYADMLSDLSTVWEAAELSEKRLVLETLITRIMLDGETVNIEWSFLEND